MNKNKQRKQVVLISKLFRSDSRISKTTTKMNKKSSERELTRICQKQWQKKENNQKSQTNEIQKKHSRNNFREWNMKVRQMSEKKNQLSKKISRLSKLRLNDVVATTFDEKMQIFKNSFFFSALNANLSDINDFTYAKSLKVTKIINKKKVNKTIAKLKTDKAFKTN